MAGSQSIRYIRNQEINRKSWDHCIDLASNGLIYAYTSYLDHMSPGWSALVLNNYEAVMPLPWRKKWGVHYIYQPFLVAQLGLFGNDLHQQLLSDCFDMVPSKFKLWEFPLNPSNNFHIEKYPFYERKNFVLSLKPAHEELYSKYRENIKRNIRKSQQYGCHVETGFNIDKIITLAKEVEPGHDQDFMAFETLFQIFSEQNKAKTYGIFSRNNELLASAAFLFSHNRAYYILVGNHPNGRTLGASHALIDAFIRDHAGQDLTLDFEGSDIRNLAFFYSSFGANEEIYPAIQRNSLPWYVKLLKK